MNNRILRNIVHDAQMPTFPTDSIKPTQEPETSGVSNSDIGNLPTLWSISLSQRDSTQTQPSANTDPNSLHHDDGPNTETPAMAHNTDDNYWSRMHDTSAEQGGRVPRAILHGKIRELEFSNSALEEQCVALASDLEDGKKRTHRLTEHFARAKEKLRKEREGKEEGFAEAKGLLDAANKELDAERNQVDELKKLIVEIERKSRHDVHAVAQKLDKEKARTDSLENTFNIHLEKLHKKLADTEKVLEAEKIQAAEASRALADLDETKEKLAWANEESDRLNGELEIETRKTAAFKKDISRLELTLKNFDEQHQKLVGLAKSLAQSAKALDKIINDPKVVKARGYTSNELWELADKLNTIVRSHDEPKVLESEGE